MPRSIRRFGRATTFTAPGVLFDTEPAAPAGGGAPPAAPAAPATPPAPAPVATSPAPGAPTVPPAPQEPATPPAAPAVEKVEDLPAWAQKKIRDADKAEGDERVAKKTLDAIQKALNPEAEGKVDPVKLAADLQATQQTAQSTALELAIYKAAIVAGAKPDALTDSRAFMEKAAGLDLTDTAALAAAVTEAVTKNPLLKAARAAGQSSVDHAGGSGEGDHTLDAQIAEAEKAGDHVRAITLKRQKAYTRTANA